MGVLWCYVIDGWDWGLADWGWLDGWMGGWMQLSVGEADQKGRLQGVHLVGESQCSACDTGDGRQIYESTI